MSEIDSFCKSPISFIKEVWGQTVTICGLFITHIKLPPLCIYNLVLVISLLPSHSPHKQLALSSFYVVL